MTHIKSNYFNYLIQLNYNFKYERIKYIYVKNTYLNTYLNVVNDFVQRQLSGFIFQNNTLTKLINSTK